MRQKQETSAKENRSAYFQFRMLPEEKQRLSAAVKKLRYYTTSAFIREAILEKVKKVERAKQ